MSSALRRQNERGMPQNQNKMGGLQKQLAAQRAQRTLSVGQKRSYSQLVGQGGGGGPRRGGVTQHDLAVGAKLLQAQQQAAARQQRLGFEEAAAALGHRIEAQRMGLDPQQAALIGAAAAANGGLAPAAAAALGGLAGVAGRGVEGSLKQAGLPMPGELELENQRLQMRVKYLTEQLELYEEWFTNRRKNMPELASLFGEPNIKQGMALKQATALLGGAGAGNAMQASLQKLQGLLAAGLPGAQSAEATQAAQAAAAQQQPPFPLQPSSNLGFNPQAGPALPGGLHALLAAAGHGANPPGLPTLAQLAQVAQLDQELVAMQHKASAAKNPLGLLESLAALQNLPGLGGLENGAAAAAVAQAAAQAQAQAQASSQAGARSASDLSSGASHRDSARKDPGVLGTPTQHCYPRKKQVGVVRKSPIEPSSPRNRNEPGGSSSSRDRSRTIKSEPGNGSSRRSSRRRRSPSPAGRTSGRTGSSSSRRRDGRDSRDRDRERPRSGSSSSSYSRSSSSRGVPYAPAHHARQLGGALQSIHTRSSRTQVLDSVRAASQQSALQQMAAAASGYPGAQLLNMLNNMGAQNMNGRPPM